MGSESGVGHLLKNIHVIIYRRGNRGVARRESDDESVL